MIDEFRFSYIGFGANRLQARLATRRAKPAGQYYLKPEEVETYMSEIPLEDVPGVGRATLAKLRNLGYNTCGDLQVLFFCSKHFNDRFRVMFLNSLLNKFVAETNQINLC